nr:putative reverse transcriptase domain-containing protein [Tanacetum cinerariifolium]
MAAPTILVSSEENLGDPNDIRMNIIHPEPVTEIAFPASTIVRTLARHREVIGVRDEREARERLERQLGLIQEELESLSILVGRNNEPDYLSNYGHHVFLEHVTAKETEDKSGEKRLEDVPIVQDFPEVFPEELSGLPLTRQVEIPDQFDAWCCTCGTGTLSIGSFRNERVVVVFSLKSWRNYLYGTKWTRFTDHKSLQHILDLKKLNMRQQRWLELLSDYEWDIRYHPGRILEAQIKALKPENLEKEDVGVGDRLMLKVSPWKGVVRFGKRGKVNPRYVGPFKVLAKVGTVAYRLELPQELSRAHHNFYVSNLKKCNADKPLVMPLEGIHVDSRLQFVEEPVETMEREIKD